MARQEQTSPRIHWDGKAWDVAFPVNDGKVLEAQWEPSLTYVIRIREAGSAEWSFGLETPIPPCTFVGLKPDTEYELQVRARNSAGEGERALVRMRTDPAGGGR